MFDRYVIVLTFSQSKFLLISSANNLKNFNWPIYSLGPALPGILHHGDTPELTMCFPL